MRAVLRLSINALAGRRRRTALLIAAVALSTTLVAAIACAMASMNAGIEKRVARTVGTRCDELLHRIVTPAPTRPVDHRGKVRSTQVLAIPDWPAFWRRRSGHTLAAIHAELAPLVDAYWAQQGTTQRVD